MWLFEIAHMVLGLYLRKVCTDQAPAILLVLLLQIASFAATQLIAPGSPPRNWIRDVERGAVTAIRHPATGLALPPRARYVRRYGAVVLHLDHYCWFLQRPIGHQNRKFFVLFACYSLALASYALFLGACDLMPLYALAGDVDCARGPMAGIMDSPYAYKHDEVCAHPSHEHWELVHHYQTGFVFQQAEERLGGAYLQMLYWMMPPTCLAIAFLAYLGLTSAQLAVRGRVWIDPHDDRYDVGLLANTRQVFGEWSVLWLLPLPGTSAAGDGVRFPINAKAKHAARAAADDATEEGNRGGPRSSAVIDSQDGDLDEMIVHDAKVE